MEELSLSFVTINRNDSYMGNSNYRLEISINYFAQELANLGKLSDAEYIVVDWGSRSPLHASLNLSENAKKITRFILVPESLTDAIKSKSDFPSTAAFNIGIRRSCGKLIGIAPADTIFSAGLLKAIFGISCRGIKYHKHNNALMAFCRKNIPLEIVNKELGVNEIHEYINQNGCFLEKKNIHPYLFCSSGMIMMHRDLWFECQGFDENILHWGWSDIDLCLRMRLRYPVKNMSREFDEYVFHLDHYPTGFNHKKLSQPVLNPFTVNTDKWGFSDYSFEEALNKHVPEIDNALKSQLSSKHFREKHWINIIRFLFFHPLQLFAVLYALKIIFIADTQNNGILKEIYRIFKQAKNKILLN